MLISFGGLPAVGKSTVTRLLAERHNAVRLRIDLIDQGMRDAGFTLQADESYRVAYALAEDNLRLGRIVIADCVNDVEITRDAWRNVAQRASAAWLEVELICSDPAEHRRRVETRITDVHGLVLPTWEQVQNYAKEPWTREHLVFDTAKHKPHEIVDMLDWPIERARKNFG